MAVAGDKKLRVFNEALRILGSRAISSLTEGRESQRVLTELWGANDEAVVACLERGEWNFAIRSAQVDYDSDIVPSFGFRRAFQKPADFCRLATLCSDEYFNYPLNARQFSDESGYWLTDLDVLYVRFVSCDSDYGLNSGNWTESFSKYLAAYLAYECCERITASTQKEQVAGYRMEQALRGAQSLDGMNEGTKIPPSGRWAQSRGQTSGRGSGLR